ncbi:tail terminator [Microbacterium phage Jenos]|nr:tail terminator [Microbacterium phage Jenos]
MLSMSSLSTVVETLEVPCYNGYAPTNAKAPYVVNRPLTVDHEETGLDGSAFVWDNQFTLYCMGGSVEASFNLAKEVVRVLQGARVDGYVIDTSIGYTGAAVEGQYESEVTAQANTGGLS